MAILVDTGALELLRRESATAHKLAIRFYPPIICSHVAAEFLYGQALANIPAPAMMEAREFLESFEILMPSLRTASIYARLRANLKTQGITIPDPDYWIAAHAIEEHIHLASTDKHFENIPEIDLHFLSK
ncbi:MAG: type II toxin-antitoxin system VapC family toxin [Terrimicrobiaceae bacterium]